MKKTKTNEWKKLIVAMKKIMSPTFPVMITLGFLMGIKAILVQTNVLQQPPSPTPTWEMLNNLPVFDAVFWGMSEVGLKFLAIFIGYSTMNYLGGNSIMSLLLGLSIANPLLLNYSWHLFYLGDIDVQVRAYPSTILPLMIANWTYFYLDKSISKITPAAFNIFRPLICYLIIVFGIYFIVGPFLYLIEQGLAIGSQYLEKIPFGINTMLLSIIWEPLVITGSHIPIGTVITMGLRGVTGEPIPSALVPAFMYGSYGQLGALLAIILKTKDKKVKKFGLANILTGLLPISGPIVYGATLPMVWPFIAGCLGAGLGGLFSGLVGVKKYVYGGFGIFGINTYWNDNLWSLIFFILSCLISIFSSTIICLLIYKVHPSEKSQIKKINKSLIKYYSLISNKTMSKKEQDNLVMTTQIAPKMQTRIKEVEKLYLKINSIERRINKIKQNKFVSSAMKNKLTLLKTRKNEMIKLLNSKETCLKEEQMNLLNGISKMLEALNSRFDHSSFLNFTNNYFNAIYSLQIVFQQRERKGKTFNYKIEKRKHNLERKDSIKKELKKALY